MQVWIRACASLSTWSPRHCCSISCCSRQIQISQRCGRAFYKCFRYFTVHSAFPAAACSTCCCCGHASCCLLVKLFSVPMHFVCVTWMLLLKRCFSETKAGQSLSLISSATWLLNRNLEMWYKSLNETTLLGIAVSDRTAPRTA